MMNKHHNPHAFIQRMALGLALVAAPYAALASIETEPVLDFKYDWNTRENPQQAVPQLSNGCAVRVAPAVDLRQNKETIGAGVGGPLLTGDIGAWVTDGLLHMKNFGLDVGTGQAAPPRGVLVKTSLTRAYTWQIGFKIFGMVALKAEFVDANGAVQQKYYRAHGDKTNMWGADSEYVTTLNYGLNNLLPVVAQDLTALCQGKKVEPYSYAGPEEPVKK